MPPMQIMVQSITERVRLSPEEGRKLESVAKRTGRTKSDVLRAGLEDQWRKARRDEEYERAWDELVRMAREVPGSDAKFRMK